MRVIVRTPAGLDLATVSLVSADDGREARLVEVPRSNGLLTYFFGKGGRTVIVEGDGFERTATLSTVLGRGRRTWHIALVEALPAIEVDINPGRMTRFPAASLPLAS